MLALVTVLCALAAYLVLKGPGIKAWLQGLREAVSMGTGGQAYLKRRKQEVPYFRIAPSVMDGRKSFLVVDPDMINSIYHGPSSDTTSWPVHVNFDYKIFGVSKKFLRTPSAYQQAKPHMMQHFSNGPSEKQAALFADAIDPQLDGLAERVKNGESIRLFSDVGTETFAMAMNIGFFGEGLPNRAINRLHDHFDYAMGKVVAATSLPIPRDLALWLFAKDPVASRDKAVLMVDEWLASGNSESGSPALHNALHNLRNNPDVHPLDGARIGFGMLFASVSNTNKSMSWLLLNLVQSDAMLKRVRAEWAAMLERRDPQDMTLAGLPRSLPLLTSCLYESQRLNVQSFTPRLMLKDAIYRSTLHPKLDLHAKAGQIIIAASIASSFDAEIYPDPYWFVGDRFYKDGKLVLPPSFHPWGGGIGICRGRLIATFEILLFTMRLLDRFDISVAGIVDRAGQPMEAETIIVGADGTSGVSCGPDRTVAPGVGVTYPAGEVLLKLQPRGTGS